MLLPVELGVCLELGATEVAGMTDGAVDFSTARKYSDQVCVLGLACPVTYVSFTVPNLVECRQRVKLVEQSSLSTVHLHAMAGKHIDHEELLVGTGHDALPGSGSDFVDQFLGGVDQLFHVVNRDFAE